MDLTTLDAIKEDVVQVVGFHVGQRLFGADIMTVREILRDPVIEPCDDPGGIVAGTLDLRGQTIPALDLRKRLGGGGVQPDGQDRKWVLVAHIETLTVGLIANDVTRIFRLSPNVILPAPDMILTGMNSPYVRGVFESELGMLVVLDVHRLLDEDEIKEVKEWVKNRTNPKK